jgi:para-nitrobenzyl esterase
MVEVTVETRSGKLRGRQSEDVSTFLGVPYAVPPVDGNRFRSPRPLQPWSGVREALEYGHDAIQTTTVAEPRGVLPPNSHPIDEDCLVLNVWSPDLEGDAPVLVWLHGGGMLSGSGSWSLTDGESLARREQVVVLTLNHRLGLLGYLHLGAALGEDFATSGNAGMLDIVAALSWVRDDIAAFGGDPNRVTIFGQSGGASKVLAMLSMPDAKGLFHRAIMQSGTGHHPGGAPGVALEEAATITETVLDQLGLNSHTAEKILSVPVEQLLAAQRALLKGWSPGSAGGRSFRPVVDGIAMPVHPWIAMADGFCADVPVIIGSTLDEVRLFLWDMEADFRADPTGFSISDDTLRSRLKGHLGERTDDVISHYRTTHDGESNLEIYVAIASDFLRIGVIDHAERKLAGGGEPPYTYLFTWKSPLHDGAFGSSHTFDIPFIFDTTDRALVTRSGPGREELTAAMSGAWAEFARSGKPSRAGLTRWPAYSIDERPTMIFNVDTHVELDPLATDRKFWEDLGI